MSQVISDIIFVLHINLQQISIADQFLIKFEPLPKLLLYAISKQQASMSEQSN